MKIIFEYEDGTYRIVPNINLTKIHEDIPEHKLIAKYMSDIGDFDEEDISTTMFGYGQPVVHLKQKYIIADDNHLAGFGPNKDKKAVWKNIQYLQRRLVIYRKLMDELNEIEDLSKHLNKSPTKTVEEHAVDEIFEYAIERSTHVLHTN